MYARYTFVLVLGNNIDIIILSKNISSFPFSTMIMNKLCSHQQHNYRERLRTLRNIEMTELTTIIKCSPLHLKLWNHLIGAVEQVSTLYNSYSCEIKALYRIMTSSPINASLIIFSDSKGISFSMFLDGKNILNL